MTISAAIHSAMSGLVAAGRASGVVSENIANAMTPGYARRSIMLSSNADAGPGVQVLGIRRNADPVLIADRRAADAEFAARDTVAEFHARFETLVGSATAPDSVGMRLADFETSLIEAAGRPDSTQRLDTVAQRARDLVSVITGAADGVRALRTQADRTIGTLVERLNQALGDTRKLNARITRAQAAGSDAAALFDQRQRLIDEINQIVPVKVMERPHGQVALYSNGGAILLDGTSATLGFSPTPDIAPHMSVENGLLSGLTINDIPVRTSGDAGAIAGGALAAQFLIRDELAVEAQADLDALAQDLVERFEDPAVDATRATGAPGLFTDAGAALDPTAVVGLSGRLAVNAAADPAQGGESWRLRAGLGAGDPGQPGDGRLLTTLVQALTTARPPVSDRLGTGSATAADVGSAVMSRAAGNRGLSEQLLGFAAAGQTEMQRLEMEQGVDTDAELQMLMTVEQSYAANARVIQALDDMMQSLLRI